MQQTVWWNSHGKLLKHDFYTWGKFFVKSQNGKHPTKLEIIDRIKIKRREARLNWKEERKKKQSRKKLRKIKEPQWKWEEGSKKEKWKKKVKLKS